MVKFMDFELAVAAHKLIKEILKVSEGEEVVITSDTGSDWRVVEATARAVSIVGGKPVVLLHNTPLGVGKAADPYLPTKSLKAVLSVADIWIEFNRSWLLYSTPYWEAMRIGRVRYMCLVGMSADMMVRTVGRVDVELLCKFQRKLAEVTQRARAMKIRTPAGTDLEFENCSSRPVLVEGEVAGPGEYMLFGQVDWAPIEDSINGALVFDGSIWPPEDLGLLRNPVKLFVREGRVYRVEGGSEAKLLEKWLRSFNDERMFSLAHISYGCNPGAKLTGNILEDERVWGVIEWGLGSQSPTFKGKLGPASSHTDGVCLNPTVWGDGEKIMEDGEYVHPELKELADQLKASR